jgi:hypothetical protein
MARVRIICALGLLGALCLGAAACGGGGSKKGGTDERERGNVRGPQRTYLFVQTLRSGTFRPAGGGDYTLSLAGVDPHALFFTDRPAIDSGVIPQKTLLRALFRRGAPPPNAAIDVAGAGRDQDVTAVQLRDPRYDARSGSLTYRARPLRDVSRTHLARFADRLDARIPSRFGSASLFIDSLAPHDGHICALNLKTSVPGGMSFQSASKWSTDEWITQPQPGSGIAPNQGYAGVAQTQGEDFRGCHFSTVFALGQSDTLEIDVTDPWSDPNSFPCTPSDRTKYTCTLDPQSTIHGPIIDIYYSVDPS